MTKSRLFLPLILLVIMSVSASYAAFRGEEAPPLTTPSHPHYTAGIEAFNREDWQGVIDHMTHALERRPWNDNAYNAMGYAYRKLGNYPTAITHYQKALRLNPYHRGALEYLGETYLHLGCREKVQEILAQLQTTCKRVTKTHTLDHWQESCEEWKDLKAAFDATPAQDNSTCRRD